MDKTRRLKGLQSQVHTLETDVGLLKTEIASKQRSLEVKVNEIKRLKDEMKKIDNTTQIKISEHAMLRYLERVKGINLEEEEGVIVTDKLKSMVDTLGGNGTYPIDGFQVVMKNYTITTVIN